MNYYDPSLWLFVILFAAAILAGFVDSIAGGGGLITAPLMLSIGAPPHVALSMGKYMGVFGTSLAAWEYIKRKVIRPKEWIWCALMTLIGSFTGALLLLSLDPSFIKKMIPPLLIAVGIYMLIPKSRKQAQSEDGVVSQPKQIASGLGLGFYDGFIGPGTGSFWTVLYNRIFNQDFLVASGVARLMNSMSNIAALVIFAVAGKVAWFMGAFMVVGFMLGSYIGARSAIRYGEKFIKPLFITLVFIIAGRLTYIEYFTN
ncbi:TSUP family transporter [Wohlfahrtiimonas chitiniclastica]|uniref:TSUP family transporter n=1 Tax=Wohlfahrtiimonas chitiniclastica TaxID=400946 RepID=UPI0007B69AA4|nr:TSUP family transporter [Wohlfahrtiimonas chitiniclastica]KZX37670.1 hypothetical protein A6V30_01985 [Wohlfahrtiimonas chitiniclastica]MBS7814600.1 TSUP family transporter [Wohlfahrtiimonas chitiniclastica]MBS7828943.1 TSUP family transporter [Wohlfahrtiimonas chitiniclastica]OYQ89788.1 hypothetical protein B9T10_00345 [Wohlfahrtiimonas chitiniclastica]